MSGPVRAQRAHTPEPKAQARADRARTMRAVDDESAARVTAMLEEVKRDALAGVDGLRSTHEEIVRLRSELVAAEKRYAEQHRSLTDRSFFTAGQLSDLGLPAPKRRRAARKKRA